MTIPDPEARLRARLAGALRQPSPEQLARWQAAVDAARAAAVRAGTAPAAATTVSEPAGVIVPEPAGAIVPEPAGVTEDLIDDAPPTPRLRVLPGQRSEADRGRPSGRVRRWFTAGVAAAGLAAVAWVGLAPVTVPQDRPLTLTREQLRTTLPTGRDFGELADPATRSACLVRLGVPGREPLAGRPVLLDGRPGVLLVLPTDRPGRLRVLVVGPTCADTLADTTTG
jgi:hypothetical protein